MVGQPFSPLPAWFGKLPGMGDFAHRRLPDDFRAAWDRWLTQGLTQLRGRHADWTAHYLDGPLWFFLLAEGVVDGRRWTGVLMPSVDGVGRYFPFMLATASGGSGGSDGHALAAAWWPLAARAALEGLEKDFDAPRFEALLQRLFATPPQAPLAPRGHAAVAPPARGHSLWLTQPDGHGGGSMLVKGLPRDDRFDALFGCDADGFAHKTEGP